MTTQSTARVYVGTYAKYNNGSLQGAWIDLEDFTDKDAFLQACAELHADESDPEFMFQDHEGIPSGMISESSISDDVWEWLEMDDDDRELLALYRAEIDSDGTLEQAQEAFAGTADSEAAFAEQTAEDCGEIPKDLPSWIVIDWEASWNSGLRYDYSTARSEDGTLYFFRNI